MEDLIYGLLGLGMFYVWIHGVVIVFRKVKDVTNYEKGVLIAGGITLTLFVLGSL